MSNITFILGVTLILMSAISSPGIATGHLIIPDGRTGPGRGYWFPGCQASPGLTKQPG
jgi:hypothetical protein